MIDNPKKAEELVEKMKEHLPIEVFSTKRFVQSMRQENGIKVKANKKLKVDDVMYSGDMGGIMCVVDQKGKLIVTSLTGLRIPKKHPLGPEIREYQEERKLKLAMQNR